MTQKKCNCFIKKTLLSAFISLLTTFISEAKAQMTPDSTLPNNTTVKIQGNITTIEGGTQVGNNLFHSFKDFSIPTGTSIQFNNAQDIQNILTRITGGSTSNIDGIISANSSANLFLINPSGIVFGPNARLDIGGSFLATTADAIEFPNDSFSATNPQAPLLTFDIPIGLQFNGNSGEIIVQGTGEGLIAPSSRNSPIISNNDSDGLSVNLGNTLVLAGGNISIKGGILRGNIELSSVDSGVIYLLLNEQGWNLNYTNISKFKNIILSEKALLSNKNDHDTLISIQGKNISLINGSTILIQNQDSPLNKISVIASDSLELKNSSSDGRFVSLIRTEALGSKSGGDISIDTKNLVIQEGASISSRTYSNAPGGNIDVNAESIQLFGFSPLNRFFTSSIVSNTLLSSGKAGNITISTNTLEAKNGGLVTSLTLGNGNGGNVTINAADFIKLDNSEEIINAVDLGEFFLPSYLSSGTFSAGNAGILTINTPHLFIGKIATVNTVSINTGSAGFININTSKLEMLRGEISSSAARANPTAQEVLNTPIASNANPGLVNINTQSLRMLDGSKILVTGEGEGDAGTLVINTTDIFLENSSLRGSSVSGKGGNIFLNIQQTLQLNENSSISATADNNGNGGNISINAGIVLAQKNSNITANAFEGRGGNIQINTKGLFLSPDSQITASSERGINGTVQINADTYLNDVTAKPEIVLQTPEMTSICQGRSRGNSEFFITGTGALAPSPEDLPDTQSTWRRNFNEKSSQLTTSTDTTEIVEAQGWVKNSDGSVTLTAQANVINPDATQSASSCNSDTNTTS